MKKGHAENALQTAPILKPEEIFDLASFNRYRYRNIFNVRYDQEVRRKSRFDQN